jgi:ADP-heptose:LPS heptosyltransferase
MPNLFQMVASSRLVIGNDSGLVKLADAFGIPTITTFLSTGPATIAQAGTLHGHNLLDPTVDEVERLARKILG